jgi:hypothetical protein
MEGVEDDGELVPFDLLDDLNTIDAPNRWRIMTVK